jgi:hypothetical protein
MKVSRFRFLCAVVALVCATGTAQSQTIGESFQTEFFENTILPGAVSVTLTDHEGTAITPFVGTSVPGLVSYVGRPKLDARTGGANAQQDVGPLSFTYNDGGSMTTVNYPIEPLGTAPGPQFSTNVAGAEPKLTGDGFIRVADNVNSLTNNVAWDTAYSGNFSSFDASFQIRLQAGGAANDNADGFGFMYLNQDPHGSSGALYTSGEEPSGTGLGIGFDIWESGGEGGNSVSLHYNGVLVGSVDVTGSSPNREAFLESGQPISVQVNAVAGTGSNPPPVLQPMSNFSVSATRGPATGGLRPMVDTDMGPGVHDAFYRLTDAVNDQGNYLTFDALPNAGSRPGFGARTGGANASHDIDNVSVDYQIGKVEASFDFRITKTGDPADGMSFVLANTDLFGTTGVVDRLTDGDGAGWEVAEDPRLAGSFGMAFKTFDADELRIRFDGADVANLGPDALPDTFANDTFVDGQWHSAHVLIMDVGPDADITISLDDSVVFSGRVAGAAGLGLVPEPSSITLLGLGLLSGLNILRRKRS